MVTLLGISASVLAFFIFLGYPLVSILSKNRLPSGKENFITKATFSLIFGLGITCLVTSIVFSFTGLRYFYALILLTGLILWIVAIVYSRESTFGRVNFEKHDLKILIPILGVIFLSRGQFEDFIKPAFNSGKSPDTSQNILAAQSLEDFGGTWFDLRDQLFNSVSVTNFQDAFLNVFRAPSVTDVAGYDYLLFGGRWGLTIPFAKLNQVFDNEIILFEFGIVLIVSLTIISFISYTIGRMLVGDKLLSIVFPLATVFNCAALYQFFEGGMSQLLGSIGIFIVALTLILAIQNDTNEAAQINSKQLWFTGFFGWVIMATVYVDAAFIVIVMLVLYFLMNVLISRNIDLNFLRYLVAPGIVAMLTVPVFSYSIFAGVGLRAEAATGTGTGLNFWPTPAQLVGITDGFTNPDSDMSMILSIISLIFSLVIIGSLWFGFKMRVHKYSVLLLSSLVVLLIGFFISDLGRESTNYIYIKIGAYLSPFILIGFFALISKLEIAKKPPRKTPIVSKIMVTFTAVIVLSGSVASISINKTSFLIVNGYKNLVSDKVLQSYLESFNYIMPYKPEYNFLTVFGAEYWISKAPNDMNLVSRMDNTLRLICYTTDQDCKPSSPAIENAELQNFGIQEYESPISMQEFTQASIIDRYNMSTDVFGMERLVIPAKFLGGNPYFKTRSK